MWCPSIDKILVYYCAIVGVMLAKNVMSSVEQYIDKILTPIGGAQNFDMSDHKVWMSFRFLG